MTVGEAVDLVLLAVNGGRLTQESSVQRAEIRALLPVAIDRFLTIEMRLRQSDARQDGADGFSSIWDDGSFFGIYTLTPVKDTTRNMFYVTLPGVLVHMPKQRAISTVHPVKYPTQPFVKASHPSTLAGAEGILGGQTFYWPETAADATKVWLYNYTGFDCDVEVWALLSTVSLDDTDQLPVPGNIIPDALEWLRNWFMQQRGTVADNDKDDSDINEDQKTR